MTTYTFGHLQLVLLRGDLLQMMSVLVMYIAIPLFVGGDYFCDVGYAGFSGMIMTVLPVVHVAHSTIFHISLNNSLLFPLFLDHLM